ncbi:hypothetical protein G7046_g4156 [Stylonectria norvegica]|nr:hypothetical protein G7046_g4156 [Stylonectria norvegica]
MAELFNGDGGDGRAQRRGGNQEPDYHRPWVHGRYSATHVIHSDFLHDKASIITGPGVSANEYSRLPSTIRIHIHTCKKEDNTQVPRLAVARSPSTFHVTGRSLQKSYPCCHSMLPRHVQQTSPGRGLPVDAARETWEGRATGGQESRRSLPDEAEQWVVAACKAEASPLQVSDHGLHELSHPTNGVGVAAMEIKSFITCAACPNQTSFTIHATLRILPAITPLSTALVLPLLEKGHCSCPDQASRPALRLCANMTSHFVDSSSPGGIQLDRSTMSLRLLGKKTGNTGTWRLTGRSSILIESLTPPRFGRSQGGTIQRYKDRSQRVYRTPGLPPFNTTNTPLPRFRFRRNTTLPVEFSYASNRPRSRSGFIFTLNLTPSHPLPSIRPQPLSSPKFGMESKFAAPCHGAVVDIGGSNMYGDVAERLTETLNAAYSPSAKPVLPDELLYDDIGLPIWNDIIFTPEFYQTHDEIALFDANGPEIASYVQAGTTVLDLGAGDTRKVEHLLAAFEKAQVPATYLALDISKTSLNRNVEYLAKQHEGPSSSVACAGIWGTFLDGMNYIQQIKSPRLLLSLGSVLCNDPWPEALGHLKFWANAMRPDDLLLIGMDAHLLPKDEKKIWAAYHSCDELYKTFFLNGFDHANRLAGEEWFHEEDWEFLAQLESTPTTRHRFFFRAKRDIKLEKSGRTIKEGEELDWFDSHKYGEDSVRLMCSKAGLSIITVWQAPDSEFRQYLVRKKGDKDEQDDADSAVSGVSWTP